MEVNGRFWDRCSSRLMQEWISHSLQRRSPSAGALVSRLHIKLASRAMAAQRPRSLCLRLFKSDRDLHLPPLAPSRCANH
jgi:hypothetical protein